MSLLFNRPFSSYFRWVFGKLQFFLTFSPQCEYHVNLDCLSAALRLIVSLLGSSSNPDYTFQAFIRKTSKGLTSKKTIKFLMVSILHFFLYAIRIRYQCKFSSFISKHVHYPIYNLYHEFWRQNKQLSFVFIIIMFPVRLDGHLRQRFLGRCVSEYRAQGQKVNLQSLECHGVVVFLKTCYVMTALGPTRRPWGTRGGYRWCVFIVKTYSHAGII